jgi:hypothetical protein
VESSKGLIHMSLSGRCYFICISMMFDHNTIHFHQNYDRMQNSTDRRDFVCMLFVCRDYNSSSKYQFLRMIIKKINQKICILCRIVPISTDQYYTTEKIDIPCSIVLYCMKSVIYSHNKIMIHCMIFSQHTNNMQTISCVIVLSCIESFHAK